MSEYLDNVFGGLETINNEAYHLERIADALLLTGNRSMAGDLRYMSANLSAASSQIRQAVGKEIHDEYEANQASVGKTINALIERRSSV